MNVKKLMQTIYFMEKETVADKDMGVLVRSFGEIKITKNKIANP